MQFHLLPAQCQNAAFERRAKLTEDTEDAQKLDSSTWSQLQPGADIFDYLERKIVDNLNGLRKCGPAGWAWRMHLNHAQPRRGMMWSTGTSQASESSHYDGSPELDADWWPVIFMVPEGGCILVPFYCPALAWSKSRPWYGNLGRIYEIVGAHGFASLPAWKDSDDVSVHPAGPAALLDHVDAPPLKDSDDVSVYPVGGPAARWIQICACRRLKDSNGVSVYPAAPLGDHVDASASKDSDVVSVYSAAPLDHAPLPDLIRKHVLH